MTTATDPSWDSITALGLPKPDRTVPGTIPRQLAVAHFDGSYLPGLASALSDDTGMVIVPAVGPSGQLLLGCRPEELQAFVAMVVAGESTWAPPGRD